MITSAQNAWLAAHPDYEIVGIQGMGPNGQPTPGTERHEATGALHTDGTFVREKVTPELIVAGVHLVGKRKAMPPHAGGSAGVGR